MFHSNQHVLLIRAFNYIGSIGLCALTICPNIFSLYTYANKYWDLFFLFCAGLSGIEAVITG
jgi:hypothetical protein